MMLSALLLLTFLTGGALALKLVGYGVIGGCQQIVRLARYRTGRCRCHLCR